MCLRKTRIKLFVCLVGVTVISKDKLWAVVSVSPVRLMWHIHGVCLRSCWTSDGSLVRKSVWKVEANSGTFEDHLRFLCFVILTGWFWEMRSVARPISPSPPPTPLCLSLPVFARASRRTAASPLLETALTTTACRLCCPVSVYTESWLLTLSDALLVKQDAFVGYLFILDWFLSVTSLF